MKAYEQKTQAKIIVLLVAIVVTCLLCEKPHFHPERLAGWNYHWWLDMLFHGGYYFTVSFLVFPFFGRNKAMAFFIVVFLISCVFEVGQAWMPGRSLSALDFLSNFLGIAGASLIRSRESLAGSRESSIVKRESGISLGAGRRL
jgi:VanZ family protein